MQKKVLYQLCEFRYGEHYPIQFSFNKEELIAIANHLNNLHGAGRDTHSGRYSSYTSVYYYINEIAEDEYITSINIQHPNTK